MTPSKRAKQLGCKSLRQVSEVSGESQRTLHNWYHNRRYVFGAVCRAVANKEGK